MSPPSGTLLMGREGPYLKHTPDEDLLYSGSNQAEERHWEGLEGLCVWLSASCSIFCSHTAVSSVLHPRYRGFAVLFSWWIYEDSRAAHDIRARPADDTCHLWTIVDYCLLPVCYIYVTPINLITIVTSSRRSHCRRVLKETRHPKLLLI